jgi:hypothetical protein
MNKEYLTEIIKLFVVKDKQNRFLEFIESSKRYEDFLLELLNDPRNINPDCITELPNNQQNPEIVSQKLRRLGAGKQAYLVSLYLDFDGEIGTLEKILSFVNGGGELVYCIGSKLGYYEGHENWRYILQAKK